MTIRNELLMEYLGVPVTWGQENSPEPAKQISEQLSLVSHAHLKDTLSMDGWLVIFLKFSWKRG